MAAFDKILDPVKRENNRLIKLNNELHLEMMTIKECGDDNDNKWRCTVRTLEGEVDDLKFVVAKLRTDLNRSEAANT